MSNNSDPVADAKTRIREITPQDAIDQTGAVFLDCREPNEYAMIHIPHAVFIPLGQVAAKVQDQIPREKKVIVYCARGNRSAIAADTMMKMGYSDVASMAAGIAGWVDAGGEVE
jgi:rhodanese-related sulfurtransferase